MLRLHWPSSDTIVCLINGTHELLAFLALLRFVIQIIHAFLLALTIPRLSTVAIIINYFELLLANFGLLINTIFCMIELHVIHGIVHRLALNFF